MNERESQPTEEVLRRVEERFWLALQRAPVSVFQQDKNLRYTWVHNPPPGLNPRDILGKTDYDFLPPEEADRLSTLKRRVLETGKGTREEIQMTLQGEVQEYLLTVEPILNKESQVTGLSAAAINITEKKKTERELARAREQAQHPTPYEELEKQRAEWISLIAHDLRQPLTAISLAAGALIHHARTLSPSQKRQTETILNSTGRLQKMIEDLLDVSRLEAKQLTLERREVDLVTLTREILERAAGLTQGRPVRLETEGTLPPLLLDPRRFEQVLGNLLSNAAQYGDPETEIQVRLCKKEKEVEISVRHYGSPLPPEEQLKISPWLYRSPIHQTAKKTSGLGLGLYICRGLVEAHGGHFQAESTPDGITTFSFTLPLSCP